MLDVQQRAGNAAAAALIESVQRKLLVGSVDDPAEREADEVAARVAAVVQGRATMQPEQDGPGSQVEAGAAAVQRQGIPGALAPLESSAPARRRPVTVLRRPAPGALADLDGHGPAGGDAHPEIAAGIAAARSGGSPLGAGVRGPFEQAFGADLGGVRIHTSAKADRLSRSLNAKAFTTGSDIFFTKGAFDLRSASGTELLAHELTHVVQQAPTVRRGFLGFGKKKDANYVPPPEAAGRRSNQQAGNSTIKVVIAGSGYGKWSSHAAEGLNGKKWLRQGIPDKNIWTKCAEGDATHPRYYVKSSLKGGGPEFLFAGPGGPGAKESGKKEKEVKGTGGGKKDVGSNTIANIANIAPMVVRHAAKDHRLAKENTTVLIKAHSRGAVAGAMVAQQLKGEFAAVEVSLFDPVPGPANAMFRDMDEITEDQYEQQDITDITESTVVYSIASGYGAIGRSFEPLKAIGAKRIILSRQGHGAGLQHGFIFNDGSGDKVYKGSALNSLPEGVYLDPNTKDTNKKREPLRWVGRRPDPGQIEQALNDAKQGRANTVLDRGRVPRLRGALGEMAP